MKLTNKTLKLAGVLSLALIGASPLAFLTAASAEPMKPVAMQYQQHDQKPGQNRHDFGQKPAQQFAQNDRDGRYGQNDRDDHKAGNNDRNHSRFGYDERRYNDRFHKPPPRFEQITMRPHFGWHYHPGHWNFQYGHWNWIGGFYSRF